ncbi:MAG TPA: hypothetical protein VJ552_07095 [Sediminibacterium sp.]|nr:hypothetical protein [Sediminibacterium sp.]
MQNILPDFVLADLYPNSLVLVEGNPAPQQAVVAEAAPASMKASTASTETVPTPEAAAPTAPTATAAAMAEATPIIKAAKPQQWFLGNNGKKITILVNEPDAVHLNEEHLNFLTKILGACQLNIGDVAIVNTLQQSVTINEINKTLNPEVCILFGVEPENIQLPFTVPYYQVQQFGPTLFLLAPAFTAFNEEAADAKLEKTRLWVSLKKIFNL